MHYVDIGKGSSRWLEDADGKLSIGDSSPNAKLLYNSFLECKGMFGFHGDALDDTYEIFISVTPKRAGGTECLNLLFAEMLTSMCLRPHVERLPLLGFEAQT